MAKARTLLLPLLLLSLFATYDSDLAEAKRRSHAPRQVTEFTGQVIRIHDGDSFTAAIGEIRVKIRLHGIDAPELSQPYGLQAKDLLGDLAQERMVRIVSFGKDKHGRTLADVYLNDGRLLNYEVVKAGMAWWFRKHSRDKKLASLEAEARQAQRGLWATRHPIPPWRYHYSDRTRHRAP